jgi:hypothetical protein
MAKTGSPTILPSVVPVVSIFCMIFLSPPVLPSVIPLVRLFIGGLITCPPINTERREITDGKTGGDKHTIKKTETTATTDCITGGDKPSNKKTFLWCAYHLQFDHQ